MKRILIIALAAAGLSGCVVAPPAPVYYSRAAAAPVDPYQWHVVSSTPVQRDAQGRIIESAPVDNGYAAQPTYVQQQPVYVAPPVYYDPYPYFPLFPLALGLGFEWGRGWHGGYRGSYRHR